MANFSKFSKKFANVNFKNLISEYTIMMLLLYFETNYKNTDDDIKILEI